MQHFDSSTSALLQAVIGWQFRFLSYQYRNLEMETEDDYLCLDDSVPGDSGLCTLSELAANTFLQRKSA
jgi:hypothetical protein